MEDGQGEKSLALRSVRPVVAVLFVKFMFEVSLYFCYYGAFTLVKSAPAREGLLLMDLAWLCDGYLVVCSYAIVNFVELEPCRCVISS